MSKDLREIYAQEIKQARQARAAASQAPDEGQLVDHNRHAPLHPCGPGRDCTLTAGAEQVSADTLAARRWHNAVRTWQRLHANQDRLELDVVDADYRELPAEQHKALPAGQPAEPIRVERVERVGLFVRLGRR